MTVISGWGKKLWKGAGRIQFLVMPKFASSFKRLLLSPPPRYPPVLKDTVDFLFI